MDNSAVGLVILATPFALRLIGLLCRRFYWTEWVQDRVLRWTGESRLCVTAWGPTIAPRRPPAPCRVGEPRTGTATGIRRSPAGVSAPTACPTPGAHAVGPTVRTDAHDHTVPPNVGPEASLSVSANTADRLAAARVSSLQTGHRGGPQPTATAPRPDRSAVAVHQPAGVL